MGLKEPLAGFTDLIQRTDERLWDCPPEALQVWEPEFLAELAELGAAVEQVFRELSDESLVLAVQKRFQPRPAFAELMVARYERWMAQRLFRWKTESHLALDLIQEMYAKFYDKQLTSFVPCRSFRTYLAQSLRNLWVERVHRGRRPVALPEGADWADPGFGPEEEAAARELRRAFDASILALPDSERQVMVLAFAGRDPATIAATLEIQPKAVFARLFRARRRVEAALALTHPGVGCRPTRVGPASRVRQGAGPESDPPLLPEEPRGRAAVRT